jgi:hypothetical protein
MGDLEDNFEFLLSPNDRFMRFLKYYLRILDKNTYLK